MADQKSNPEAAPRLVTPDGPKPVASTMTRDELFAGIKLLADAIAGTRASDATLADGLSKTIADAFERMEGKFRDRDGEWNIAKFPARSDFNPLGDNEEVGGLARPLLNGEVFWVGTPMDEREMTREAIELANQLEPVICHAGQWKVIDLTPGQKKRALLVVFPCAEPDQRASLPSDVEMMREMVAAAQARKAPAAVA